MSSIFYEEILLTINCGLIQLVVMGEYFSQCAYYVRRDAKKKYYTSTTYGNALPKILRHYRGKCFDGVPRRVAKLFVPAYWIQRVPIRTLRILRKYVPGYKLHSVTATLSFR